MAKKKKTWIEESINKGTVGVYGFYYINIHTHEMIYVALKKDRSSGIHHKSNSISIDLKTLNEIQERNIKKIVVKFRKSKDRFVARVSDFLSEKATPNYDSGDKGIQIRLPLSCFVERKSDKL